MTHEDRKARIEAIEAWYHHEIDLLSSVSARARPSSGESNVIHDVVAAMARQAQNAQAIADAEAVLRYLGECIDAAYYGMPDPEIETGSEELHERIRCEANKWKVIWEQKDTR